MRGRMRTRVAVCGPIGKHSHNVRWLDERSDRKVHPYPSKAIIYR